MEDELRAVGKRRGQKASGSIWRLCKAAFREAAGGKMMQGPKAYCIQPGASETEPEPQGILEVTTHHSFGSETQKGSAACSAYYITYGEAEPHKHTTTKSGAGLCGGQHREPWLQVSGLRATEASVLVREPGRGRQQTANCCQGPSAGALAGKQDVVQDKPELGLQSCPLSGVPALQHPSAGHLPLVPFPEDHRNPRLQACPFP